MKSDKEFLNIAKDRLKQLKARVAYIASEKGLKNIYAFIGEDGFGANGEREYYQ